MLQRIKASFGKWFPPFVVLLAVLVLLCLNATNSGLWYDEAIEYYYSRVASGPVPGGSPTLNMYERITETYQPPLYNWLMHLWLLAFDSEFGFRLGGILATILGGAGMFLALKKVTSPCWAATGAAAYLLTGHILIYALECGEYNLMLCFLCWTLFFFLDALLEEKRKPLGGFFICACLSVYSQYGAAFLILPLYLALLLHFLKQKKLLREFLLFSFLTLLAAIPLVSLFLIPQLGNQGTTEISHFPVFRKGSLAVDFVYEIYLFLKTASGGRTAGLLIALLFGCAAAAVFPSPEEKSRSVLRCLLGVAAVTWIVFYAAVACSFYGYNAWDGPLGTYNLNGRYVLFYLPLLILFTFCGLFRMLRLVREKWNGTVCSVCLALILIALVIYSASGIGLMRREGLKDDVREVEIIWIASDAPAETTLVHSRSDAMFQFYLTHDPRYQEEMQDHLITSGRWMVYTDAEEIIEKLSPTGVFEADPCYLIATNSDFMGSYHEYLAAFERMGYSAEPIYEGVSSLLRFSKK